MAFLVSLVTLPASTLATLTFLPDLERFLFKMSEYRVVLLGVLPTVLTTDFGVFPAALPVLDAVLGVLVDVVEILPGVFLAGDSKTASLGVVILGVDP